MARFFKSLFSSSSLTDEKKKDAKQTDKSVIENKEENKEFTIPQDSKRKLSISRSGRMKQNLKARGKLGGDLYDETEQKREKTKIEYYVNKSDFFEDTVEPKHEIKTNSCDYDNRLTENKSIESDDVTVNINGDSEKDLYKIQPNIIEENEDEVKEEIVSSSSLQETNL